MMSAIQDDIEGNSEVKTGTEVKKLRLKSSELQNQDETWAELPDLILIDGGIGQLNGALAVLRELRFDHIPTVGVVKGVHRDRFDLLLSGASELIVLKRDSAALRLIQTIDEETDRFAKNYHRSLRTKSALTSTLEEIPGIGPQAAARR